MGRVKGLLSLAVTVAAFALVLRLVHVLVPAVYPSVLSGPFSLSRLSEVSEYTGFTPLVPFYFPIELGAHPVHITVDRRPRPRLTVFWQAERFLVLIEELGGEPPVEPPDARDLPGVAGGRTWSQGRTQHATASVDGLRVTLRTDLEPRDVERLMRTLRHDLARP